MSDVVIKVENLGKQYRLGSVGTGTISHDLNRWWHKARGKEDPYLKIGETNDRTQKGESDFVWVLKDINFEVNKGEVLGIIGKNGAGKSTLLKILSRVTGPTVGDIKIKGRIASLLEVGTGFHPELTGRENIFLNGAILGMTKKEILSKFDEIVAFSGVERYIDTPVKRYSSGMYVRLAFAVAAHLEPEILIVDEVLAVGDIEFQKKCLGKMKDVSGEGRTVLFVSHNMSALKTLCTSSILLQNGRLIKVGKTDAVINHYLGTEEKSIVLRKTAQDDHPNFVSNNIKLHLVELISENNFSISDDTLVRFVFENYKPLNNFNLSLVLYSDDEMPIFNTISNIIVLDSGINEAVLNIPKNLLNEGLYRIRILFVENSKPMLDINDVLVWRTQETLDRKIAWYGKYTGVIRPDLNWKINKYDGKI